MADRVPSALTRAAVPNVKTTVNNNKLMAGYYGGRYQQQALQQQMYQQQQQQNSNQNTRTAPQQQKNPQYQNRKSTTFNENSMDAILTCDINDVYPMPEVVIFRRDFNGTNPYALKIFQIEVSSIELDIF